MQIPSHNKMSTYVCYVMFAILCFIAEFDLIFSTDSYKIMSISMSISGHLCMMYMRKIEKTRVHFKILVNNQEKVWIHF